MSALAALFAATLCSQPSVLTWHNDNFRTGQNLQETILTPANVNSTNFGKLFTIGVDGKVDAQPLYVPHLTIPGQGVHNVLYIATEHNSVYGFDADSGAQLLHVSLLVGSESTSDDHSCGQVTPEIGITATPVIDPANGPHGTIYVVAMSKDTSSHYHQRIHALDLTTLAEEFGGPTEIAATAAGSPEESTFLPGQHEDRAGLLLSNGVIYTTWSSHCDARPYTSWVIGYSASTLARTSVLNLEPKGIQGAVWAAGSGPQADAAGNIYVPTGNGTFDTTLLGNGMPSNGNFGNAYVKISTSGAPAVSDYFTMSNTVMETNQDTDLGSGGGLLLPPLLDTLGHSRDLAVIAGKDSNIYVMDRSNLGKFNPNSDEIYQQLSGVLANGVWASPAWFNGSLYYGPRDNVMKAFLFANGKFSTNPSSQTSATFQYPGTTPSISANGTSNGIVWAVGNGTAVLRAYNASNLGSELYNSNLAAGGRDQFGSGNKFIVPTIANGKVYVASNGGVAGKPGSVAVFGLLAPQGPTAVSISPSSGSGSSQTFIATFSDSSGAADIQSARILFNRPFSPANACYLVYKAGPNTLNLLGDDGVSQSGFTIGTSGTLSNSQCSVNVAASSKMSAGNTLTLNLAVTFTSAFAGAKDIYMEAKSLTITGNWYQLGAWTVTEPSSAPTAVSISPSSGSGSSQTFVATFSDAAGAADIQSARILFNRPFSPANACYLVYKAGPNTLNLLGDDGVSQSGFTIGTSGTLSNSQCSVDVAASSKTSAGNTLTLNLAVTFKPAFAGAKDIFLEAKSLTVTGDWLQKGTWSVSP